MHDVSIVVGSVVTLSLAEDIVSDIDGVSTFLGSGVALSLVEVVVTNIDGASLVG